MRVKVKKAFKHLNTGRIWLVGEMFEGEEAAVEELASKGFLDYKVDADEAPEAGPVQDFGSMTVKELSAICAERGIVLKGKTRKADMLAAIEASEAGE